jgi:hypothetical protein
MYFRKECEVVPVYQDITVDGSNMVELTVTGFEPGTIHYYINGEEVPEDEYEYFWNEQYKDGYKEQTNEPIRR